MLTAVASGSDLFRDWMKARREVVEIDSWEDFARAGEISLKTVHRVLTNGPGVTGGTHLESRQRIARGLGFNNWASLIASFDEWQRRVNIPASDLTVELDLETHEQVM